MDVGDVFHYILIQESGASAIVNLVSSGTDNDNVQEPPDAVVALAASDITSSSFTANWEFIENATGYYLDVATDSAFTAFVAGYNNLSVGFVKEYSVIGIGDGRDYFYRVRGINDQGQGDNSNVITVVTDIDLVTDLDGNVYTYVTIGTQQWLVENFKCTQYADGTPIPNLTLAANWIAEDGTAGHDGAYCWYDNDIANKTDYGALYNWFAVNNGHGLALAGWRVPTDTDWDTMNTFLGNYSIAGGKLKEVGLSHWATPNTGAANEDGFTALPSGYRYWGDGNFSNITLLGLYWSSVQQDVLSARGYVMSYNGIECQKLNYRKKHGFAVRMMRDLV